MTRLATLALAAAVLATLTCPAAAATPQDHDQAITGMLEAAEGIWKYGSNARSKVRSAMRDKNNESVSSVLRQLRRQLRKVEVKVKEVDDADLTKHCEAFCAAARGLIGAGTAASPSIDAAVKKHEANVHAKALLEKVDGAIWQAVAHAAVKKFAGKGQYLGMFDDLKPNAPKVSKAMLALFLDNRLNPSERGIAGEGVAQLGEKGDKDLLKELKDVFDDVSEERGIRNTAVFTMARLGDRSIFNEQFANPMKNRLNEELKKEKPDPNVVYGVHRQLASVYQGINDYKQTAYHYITFVRAIAGAPYEKLPSQQRAQFASLYYNFGCVASRLEKNDLAMWCLNNHFNYGGDLYDWARADGDLANARKDPRFEACLKEWKGGKTLGSYTTDVAQVDAWRKELTTLAGYKVQEPKKAEGDGKKAAAGDEKTSKKDGEKKADEKKLDGKKPDEKKADEKKADEKKAAEKKAAEKKTAEKKTDGKPTKG